MLDANFVRDADFDLLPQTSTPFERAMARGVRRISNVPTPIREAFRPFETPTQILPFLAWERSVDVWDNDWDETLKRTVTDRSIPLHKRKGTAYCLREYVRYAGGAVGKIITPPQKTFSGPSLTREQREAWLSRLPQVRTWRIRDRIDAPAWKSFYGGYHHAQFAETAYAVPSTALSRLKRRARWVVGGSETETRVSDFGSYFRLHMPADAGVKVFSGTPSRSGRFYVPSDAWRRLVTIEPKSTLAWRSAVGPSLQAVTSEPERVKVSGTRGKSVFSDAPLSGFFVPTSAPLRIFERYAVHDGSRELKRPAINFMGVGRYGFPAHTAKAELSIPGRRSKFAAGEGVAAERSKFWLPPPSRSRLDKVLAASRSAKRLSDKILFKIGPTPRFVAGRSFLSGADFIVGQP